MIDKIIKELKEKAKSYSEIKRFSDQPGIYAFFFYGKTFPLKGFECNSTSIIYIGKTLKSQKSRDADTHFKTGKTGSSTLRKTFGSLLYGQYKLNPIPRSQKDIDAKRYAHFKFDVKSEKQLTKWMADNLGLSFYPYLKSGKEIDDLETLLIKKLVPVLNIDRKNTDSVYFSSIRLLRKQMSQVAYAKYKIQGSSPIKTPLKKLEIIKRKVSISSGGIHKYESVWRSVIPFILKAIKNNESLFLQLSGDSFDKAGDRKNYSSFLSNVSR